LLGGDFASKHDIVALMQLFVLPEEKYALFGKYYLPEDTINLPENQHYQNWERTGWLTKTPGSITDLEYLTNDAEEMMKQCNVEEMVCDPNRAWGVFPQLQKRGLPVVEYRNTVMFMSEPTKQLDALIRSGRIVHNGDPVLAWAISNVTAKLDKKDNVYPNKDTARNKIDPVVSTLFALGRAMVRTGEPATSGFSFG
jgi:phage terminase large subunit-like protein